MAPYLILGFSVASLLHLVIRKENIQQLLGKPGLGGVLKASLLGVPIPLCSCSVIPIAAFLRKHGASKGATASFLSSTPQTGVDSILATYALMGGIFTVIRVTVALVCGLVSGFLVDLFETKTSTISNLSPPNTSPPPKRSLRDALRHGLVTLPSDLAVSLITGLVLAGLIASLLPEQWLHGRFSTGWPAFLIATVIGLPLYVCATASIPMAYALIACGLSPGAALVFLIVGPATNTATVVAAWKLIGRRATAIYIISLVILSWMAGWLLNTGFSPQTIREGLHNHEPLPPVLWQHLSGISLLVLLVFACWKAKRLKRKASCCDSC